MNNYTCLSIFLSPTFSLRYKGNKSKSQNFFTTRPKNILRFIICTVIISLCHPFSSTSGFAATVIYRINAGGPELTSSPSWEEDTVGSPSPFVNTGNPFSTGTAIDLSDPSLPPDVPAALFQSVHWDPAPQPEMKWDFPVTPGTYEVRLYFAETYSPAQAAGARVFDVSIEGGLVLNDYDIFADVGGFTGVMKSFQVVSDNNLDIDFARVVNTTQCRGIEIISNSIAGELGVTPSSVPFGTLPVGSSSSQAVQLTNLGDSGDPDIVVQSTALIGANANQFSEDFSGSVTLTPGESTLVTITFNPQSAGNKMATLEVTHDGTNNPLSIPLSGVGNDPSNMVIRINAGGPELAGSTNWDADTGGSPSPFVNTGSPFSTGAAIDLSNPSLPSDVPATLFQTGRWDPGTLPEMEWDFPVSPGDYEVRLYFAETYAPAQAVGVRVFDVSIEGAIVLDDYDIFADVGGFTGVMKSFQVVSDDNLDIDFARVASTTQCRGIEIIPKSNAVELEVSQESVNFGPVTVGQSDSQAIQLTNLGDPGDSNLMVQSLAFTGADAAEFDNDFSGPVILAPGDSTQVTITFNPQSAGNKVATLEVSHDGSNNPSFISLSGRGDNPSNILFRVNAGGPELTATPNWDADTGGSPSPFVNTGNPFTSNVAIDLSHPSLPADIPAALFQSGRWDPSVLPEMKWDFPVSPGTYEVRLYFAETYSPAHTVGARVFDVSIEGGLVLDDYDIFADVGGFTGVMKNFVVVSDGNLDIDFERAVSTTQCRGIEIIAISMPGELAVTPNSVPFGEVPLGVSNSQTVELTNLGDPGDPDIIVQSTALTGVNSADFTDDFAGPLTLAPGASTQVTITFNPQSAGNKIATLEVTHDGTNNPLSVPLSGIGNDPSNIVIRVNAGGPELIATPNWDEDTANNPSPFVNTGNPFSSSGAIDMSHPSLPPDVPETLFKFGRWDHKTPPEMEWDFPVPAGEYEVRLYFAETYKLKVGGRVFDVSIEGDLVLDDYDIFADVGGFAGVMKTFVVVSDTNLDIDFSREILDPECRAIEIIPKSRALELAASPASVDFGSVILGQSSSQAVQLTNLGEAGDPDIVVQSVAITGADAADFGEDFAGPVTLTPGASVTVNVAMVPLSAGANKTATLEVTHNGNNNPLEVALKGIATNTNHLGPSSTSLNFGSVGTGQSGSEAVQLTNLGNPGDPDIVVQTVTLKGAHAAEFSEDFAGPITLALGEAIIVNVTMSPISSGNKAANLEIIHNGNNNPLIITLSGVAANVSDLGATPTSVDFGTVMTTQSSSQVVQLTNQGNPEDLDILVQSIAIIGNDAAEFTDDFGAPVPLAPGDSTSVNVSFNPVLAGNKMATLQVIHSGNNNPLLIPLTAAGEGMPASLFRVNVGGPGLTDSPNWEADTVGSPTPYVNVGNRFSTNSTIDLSDPSLPSGVPADLFKFGRFDPAANPEMEWDFPVTPGIYEVRLYFAETFAPAQSVGARVFDISIEGGLVLNNYDIYADVGGFKGVMKSFSVVADDNIDIDFAHEVFDPQCRGIEIVPNSSPGELAGSPVLVEFGAVLVGGINGSQILQLSNLGNLGDPDIVVQSMSITGADSAEFSVDFNGPVTLSGVESTTVNLTFAPANVGNKTATVEIIHDGINSPVLIDLVGLGANTLPIGFGKSILQNATITKPTSLQFGPDGRLYVSEQNGAIKVFTITRNGPSDYSVTAEETISAIQTMPNHNDQGIFESDVPNRLVTGLLVTGTPTNPVIYVNSSDPRIGAGPSGQDLNLDTNSGILSRLTWNGTTWEKLDLVRGLPRSEENHTANGLALDPINNNLLYIAMGGNTNAGAISNNFALLPEYALSAAILKVDLSLIGETTYDLPTLDDEDRNGPSDANDPFGGNNGKNQAIIDPNGPVQVHAPGFRNPYDILVTADGRMFTIDNGPNTGWGDVPIGEGPQGACTNDLNEPGVTFFDNLHYISGPGYYGGHPNPTRGNMNNTFNEDMQSPVPFSNPIECDFREPGVEDGALTTFVASTNGLTEYTASNFGGAMVGDLIAASFSGQIFRMVLDASGTGLVSKEALFSNVGATPLVLDVTAQGENEVFPGTIWVADIFGHQIVIYEPTDFGGGGGSTCTGAPDPLLDEDGDGYNNLDEIQNETSPCSAGDIPFDFDGDFISNLNDPDDDNDGLADDTDPFAIDPDNGASTSLPVLYTWENDAPNPGGLLNLGFTGLMSNGNSNYADLFDAENMTAGGAAGVMTVDIIPPGDALNNLNSQEYGFQFGVNVDENSLTFTAATRILAPFTGVTPENFQSMGLFVGTGDQDNYVKLVLSSNGGNGGVEILSEVGGVSNSIGQDNLALPGPEFVDLYLEVQPDTQMIQGSYEVTTGGITGPPIDLGNAIVFPSSWLTGTPKLAVGIISTGRGAASTFTSTWDFIEVLPEPGTLLSEAHFAIDPVGSDITASTFGSGAFQLTNTSAGGQKITRLAIDLSTAILPDVVFDPDGLAGDTTAKGFTPDSGASSVGLQGHTFSNPHDGGFDILEVTFTDFNPGELFTFSGDVDPTSIKGSSSPGPNNSGGVSGLELTGSTVVVEFDDGSQYMTELFAVEGSVSESENTLNANPPPEPTLEVLGITSFPTSVTDATQTVRIHGPNGSQVALLLIEGGLFTDGVPGGGFDLDPFEANTAIDITEHTATIGLQGFVDISVTLSRSLPEAGFNYITAVIRDSVGNSTSTTTPVAIIELLP